MNISSQLSIDQSDDDLRAKANDSNPIHFQRMQQVRNYQYDSLDEIQNPQTSNHVIRAINLFQTATSHINSQNHKIQKQQYIQNLLKLNSIISPEQRMEKAARHFKDAMNFLIPRNDFDAQQNSFTYYLFLIQTSNAFNDINFVFSFLYLILSFFEPANQNDLTFSYPNIIQDFEILFLSFFTLDIILEIIHLSTDEDRTFKQKYIKNYKCLIKIILCILFLSDFIILSNMFPNLSFRYSRFFRPCLMFIYNKELTRQIIVVYQSNSEIVQMLLFIGLLTTFFSIISLVVIGSITASHDEYTQDYNSFSSMFLMLYGLISFDGYPNCMIPAVQESSFYIIYFLTYISLYIFFFLPVPVATVYEAYRKYRCQIQIQDRIIQREGLLACFLTLDFEQKKTLNQKQFTEFFRYLYLFNKSKCKLIRSLYLSIDKNDSDSVSLTEFFEIIEIMENHPKYNMPTFKDNMYWVKFRKYMNSKFQLKSIVLSDEYEFFMTIILILNCGEVIASNFLKDTDSSQNILDIIDNLCMAIYILEFLIKLIGLGISKYFIDEWNKFDFAMIIISVFGLFLQNITNVLKNARSVKSSKILKLTKLNKLFRTFRACRTIKIVSVLFYGFDTLVQLKNMIQRIFICIPMIIKLFPTIITLLYVYNIIGITIFNTDTMNSDESIYNDFTYCNFTSFYEGLLLLFQVMIEQNWVNFIYNYGIKFQSLLQSAMFFISFHFLMQLVLISLIKGIVWEVFTVVEQKHDENQQKEEQMQENQEKQDENGIINKFSQQMDKICKKFSRVKRKQKSTLILSATQVYTKHLFLNNFYVHRIVKQINNQLFGKKTIEMPRRHGFLTQNNVNELPPLFSFDSHNQDGRKLPIQHPTNYQTHQRFMVLKILNLMKKSTHNLTFEKIRTHFNKEGYLLLLGRIYKLSEMIEKQRNDNGNEGAQLVDSEEQKLDYIKQITDNIIISIDKFHNQNQNNNEANREDLQITQSYLNKKAILKDINPQTIKMMEIEYFTKNYGNFFYSITEFELEPLLKFEATLLYSFQRILSYQVHDPKIQIMTLLSIEAEISRVLFRKGSTFKFIYQDNLSNWFTLYDKNGNCLPQILLKGPWTFEKLLFPNQNEIYISLDFLQPTQSINLRKVLDQFVKQFYILSLCNEENAEFTKLNLDNQMIDFFYFQSEVDKFETIQNYISNVTDYSNIIVKKFGVVLLYNSGLINQQIKRKKYKKAQQNNHSLNELRIKQEKKYQDQLSLPFSHTIEMMKNLQQMLEVNKVQFLSLISQCANLIIGNQLKKTLDKKLNDIDI